MSKTIISLLVVGMLAVGGYLAFNSEKAVAPENTEEVATEQDSSAGKKMAFSDFLKQGRGDYKCEVKQAMSDFENSGTVYINSKNLRGEFSTIAEGRSMDTTFIVKDGYSYTWSSALPNMGWKVKIVEDAGDTSADASGAYSWDATQIGDYNCEPWNPDPSKFTLPTNITFKEMTTAQ